VAGVGALIIETADVDRSVSFYRTVAGLDLQREQHDPDDEVHFAVDVDGCHVAIFGGDQAGTAPAARAAGETMVGFAVGSVEVAVEAARSLGARVLQEPEDYPWGRRALVEDPDGRRVEVFVPGGDAGRTSDDER
jgi:lactoylglutathione lyase